MTIHTVHIHIICSLLRRASPEQPVRGAGSLHEYKVVCGSVQLAMDIMYITYILYVIHIPGVCAS